MRWPTAAAIMTERLRLEPLGVDHAAEMTEVLRDEALYAYIGGEQPTEDELRQRYRRQCVGHSADGSQGWLNWIIRDAATRSAAGYVQATVTREGDHQVADIAWLVSTSHQGRGVASEASRAMVAWLRDQGIDRFQAYVHPDHGASAAVAQRVGLAPTEDLVDGEVRWVSRPPA